MLCSSSWSSFVWGFAMYNTTSVQSLQILPLHWHPQWSLNGHYRTVFRFKPFRELHSRRNSKSLKMDLRSLWDPRIETRQESRFNSVYLLQILGWISSSFASHRSQRPIRTHSRCLRTAHFLRTVPCASASASSSPATGVIGTTRLEHQTLRSCVSGFDGEINVNIVKRNFRQTVYVSTLRTWARALAACQCMCNVFARDSLHFICKTQSFIPENDRPQFVVLCVLLQVTVTVTPEHAGRGIICAWQFYV